MFAKRSVERKLTRVTDELRRIRDDLEILDAQLVYLADEADDLAMRAAVSDDLSVGPEARRAREHADAQHRERDRLRRRIVELERHQDELLDRWSAS